MNTHTMSTTQINQDFIIRIRNREGYSGLTSARNFFMLVADIELGTRLVDRVYDAGRQVMTVKLRRGIEFDFVSR